MTQLQIESNVHPSPSETSEDEFNPTIYVTRDLLENCTAVDLFCGAGGLTYGLKSAGLHVAAGIDIDGECHYPFTINTGSSFLEKSVTEISGDLLMPYYPLDHIKVLVGCAPCQDFSKMSRAKRAAAGDKWALLREFTRLIKELRPDIISMENVPEVSSHIVYREFTETLEALDYNWSASKIDCAAYGVPQSRERFVLFASQLGPITMIAPTFETHEYQSVEIVLRGMEVLNSGQTSKIDPLHKCSKLSPTNRIRIQSSKPGGTWRDWPQELRCACHQKSTGETYPSVYGRMEGTKPAPTMTTQYFGYGNGRFGHPEQDRAISLREGALIQSFPKDYKFVDPEKNIKFSTVGRLVGNAVPPRLGEAVGLTIRNHIEAFRACA